MFLVDLQSKTPIFEQLKKQILEFISIGVLSPDDKLPSVRMLASQLGINPNTVAKAYQELEAQGYIYTAKGKGCFVSGNHTDEKIKHECLTQFQTAVMEMQRHHIEKAELIQLIEQIYKEGTK